MIYINKTIKFNQNKIHSHLFNSFSIDDKVILVKYNNFKLLLISTKHNVNRYFFPKKQSQHKRSQFDLKAAVTVGSGGGGTGT